MPGTNLRYPEIFHGFLQSVYANSDLVPQFLPNSFQFINYNTNEHYS